MNILKQTYDLILTNNSDITSLSTAIINVSGSSSDIGSLSTVVSIETSVRGSANTSLTTRISTEESVRDSADTSILTIISTEDSTTLSTAKAYTDAIAQGISPHAPARLILTGNTVLSGLLVVDGITTVNGDSVLVVGQTDKTTNGIYVVTGTTWSRRSDADGNPNNEIELGDFVFIESGLTNASSGWVLGKTDAPTGQTFITTGDTQEWYKMAAPGSYTTDGIGINLNGNVFTISSEISIRSSSDTSLATRISNEEVTRLSVDNSLSTVVNTVDDITSDVSAGDLIYFDGIVLSGTTNLFPSLSSAISSLSSGSSGNVDSLSTSLSTETSVRSSSDTSLTTRVSTEEVTRLSVDNSLSTSLSTETSIRSSSDTSLTTRVSTEEVTRLSVDNSLSTSISTETSIRESVDLSLSNTVNTLENIEPNVNDGDLIYFNGTTLSGTTNLFPSLSTSISSLSSGSVIGVESLSTSLSNETSVRGSSDTSLTTRVSTEEVTRLSVDNSLSTSISTETSLRSSVDSSLSSANLWTVSNDIVSLVNSNYDVILSNIELPEDGGILTILDMLVTTGVTVGTEESYSFNLDGNSIVKIYGQASGTTGVTNTGLVLNGDYFYMGNPITDGSWRWFINVDGDMEFQKLVTGTWTYKNKFT
jgi:hypothetical protein